MTQPIRLRDGADPDLRALLSYTQAVGAPSTARVDALTARVLAQLAAPASEPAGPSDRPAAPALGFAKWLVGATLLLALGILVYWLLERAPHAPSLSTAPAAAPVPAPPAAEHVPAPVQELAPEPHAPAPRASQPEADRKPARSQTQMRTKRAERPSASAPAKRANATGEVVLLQRARGLVASDPQGALAVLAQHQLEHPAGIFIEEREALAVEALWRAGAAEQAARRLQALLGKYPRSTYRERLTTLLERRR